MSAVAGVEAYLEPYLQAQQQLERRAAVPAWLETLRRQALDRLVENGLPSTRNEEWRFTNTAPITRTAFRPVEGAPVTGEMRQFVNRHAPGVRLVLVNGRYSPALSALDTLPPGVIAAPLATVFHDHLVGRHLARHAGFSDPAEGFAALNTAMIEDGAFLHVAAGAVVNEPLYLVHLAAGEGAVAHPRLLALLCRDSQTHMVEVYGSVGPGVTFTNAVSELICGGNAIVEHYKLQLESERAFHVGVTQVYQERSSVVADHNVVLGGRLVRNDVNFVLDGEGAEGQLNGLYVTNGRQHVDNRTKIDNRRPHCPSRELYKGILDGQSSAVFNGGIIVRQEAQKTDAKQSNKNLLLSEDAVINTKPQLEIWADDVKCTHGATVGQIDADALFYLRSRGIGQQEARSLLTYAFSNEMLARMKVEGVRKRMEEELHRKLGF
jgi:Fe-S cluster assembly protein SufD